jgi:hypothetical protein
VDRADLGRAALRAGWLALLAGVPACEGGDPIQMAGRQVLEGRDVGNLFFWKEHTLGLTRDTADPAQPEPEDFWIWRLDEPEPSLGLSGVRWSPPLSWPLWVAGDLMLTGTKLERVYDVDSRRAAHLFQDFSAEPGPDQASFRGVLAGTAMRTDGHGVAKLLGARTIVVGRPPELRVHTLPEGITVGRIVFLGTDLGLLVRETTPAGDIVGVQRLDTATGALTPLVAATAADEWVGVTGFCEDLSPTPCGLFDTVGCGIDQPACPDGRSASCQLVYAKVDPDEPTKTALYAHDVGAGTSRRLAGSDPDGFFVDRAHHLLAWASAADRVTRYWNVCGDATGECPGWNELIAFRPDGGAFAMYGSRDSLRVVDVAGATCISPDPSLATDVRQAQFAPGSDRMWWVASNLDGSAQTLWLADGAARAPVAISSGGFLGAGFTPDGQRVYVSHVEESTAALGCVDVGAPAPAERILSTNYGDVALLGSRRAVFVDHFNAQDGNGELVLVELATGVTRSLARAVTSVAVAGRQEAEGTDLAYAVRGRAGSSRDGLWLTTLPP